MSVTKLKNLAFWLGYLIQIVVAHNLTSLILHNLTSLILSKFSFEQCPDLKTKRVIIFCSFFQADRRGETGVPRGRGVLGGVYDHPGQIARLQGRHEGDQGSDRTTLARIGVYGVGDVTAVGGEVEVVPQVFREDGRRRSQHPPRHLFRPEQ